MEHLFCISALLPPLSPMGWQPKTGKDGFASLMFWLHIFCQCCHQFLSSPLSRSTAGRGAFGPFSIWSHSCAGKKNDPIAQKLSIFWSFFQSFTAQHWQEVVIHCKSPTEKAAGSEPPLVFFFVKLWTFGPKHLGCIPWHRPALCGVHGHS